MRRKILNSYQLYLLKNWSSDRGFGLIYSTSSKEQFPTWPITKYPNGLPFEGSRALLLPIGSWKEVNSCLLQCNWLRHRLLRHCSRCTARIHISPIPLYHLDYVLRTSIDKIKENSFKLTKKRSRRYPTKTITDADYADDIALLANALAQAKTLLHSLEWVAAGIGLHFKAHKNETGDISTLNDSSLKLVDKFTYLGSSVSSTEADTDMQLAKAWTVIN